MAHNFHDINGMLIVGMERHEGIQFIPWPPLPMVFWKLNLMHPFTMGGNEKPKVLFNGVPSVVHKHEPEHLWPHIGVIPHPFDLLTPLQIAFGSHICWLPRGAVEICGEKATCCVIGGPVSMNADCWDTGKWPCSLVLNPGTVETTPTFGDFVMGAVTLAIEYVLDKLMEHGVKGIGKLLGKFYKKVVKPLASRAKKAISGAFKAAVKKLGKLGKAALGAAKRAGERIASACKNAKCNLGLEPVDLASGRVVESEVDLSLPGVIPLLWERHYSSASALARTSLGRGGWTHSLEQWIAQDEEGVVLRDQEGRDVYFPAIAPGESIFHRPDRLTLTALDSGSFTIYDHASRLTRHFSPASPGGKALLSSIRDAHGNAITLDYVGERLCRVVDTAGRELRVKSTSGGRIVRVEVWADERLEQWVDYTYAKMGELASAADALGHAERYEYDDDHRMTKKTLKNGVSFYYAYDEKTGWCNRSWGDDGLHTGEIKPDLENRITVLTGDEPRVLHWNQDGLVVREETPDGILIKTSEYDGDQYLVAESNGAGETTRYEYDARGNKVKEIDPAGNVTEWHYEDDLPTIVVRADGLSTRYEHDARGSLVEARYPTGAGYALSYDDRGRLRTVREGDRLVQELAYDARHDVVEEVDARGAKTEYAYDRLGRAVSRTDALGRRTSIEYDLLGQPLGVHRPDGTVARSAYDALGNPVRTTNALGQVTEMEYSGTGVLAKLKQPDEREWTFKYTPSEKLRRITNPRGEEYEFVYDTAGRVTEEATFDGRTLRYRYSAAGRLDRIDYPDGSFRAFSHDPLGNVLEEESTDGPIHFQRDRMGRLLGAVVEQDGKRVLTLFERDRFGRVVAETHGDRTLRYEHDARGRRTARVMPDGATTRYAYDALDELVGVEHDGRKLVLQRDLLGRETARGDAEGRVSIQSGYDAMDRLAEQRVAVPQPGGGAPAVAVQRRWRYDALGRVDRIDDARWGATAYRYDAIGQLVEARRGAHREVFEYDAAGSIHKMLGGLDSGPREGGEELWEIAPGNLLKRTERAEYAHDRRGRRIAKQELREGERGDKTEYVWDCRDRLREVELPSGEKVVFAYDAFGRRTQKGVVAAGGGEARSVDFLWDGDVLAADLDSERGARCFVHEPGTFVPLLQAEQGEVLSYVNDHLGMPKELIDESGRVAWSAAHSAWGRVTETRRDPAARRVESPFRLLGQYADGETGLCYTRFRYFDAAVGRWCSPDPLGIEGGNNVHAFDDSPTVGVDPFGLACKKPRLPRYDGPKPKYHVNPAHDPGSPLFNPKKTPLPNDAERVFKNAVPDDSVKPRNWYGTNLQGQTYRFSGGGDGTAHFSGIDGVGDGTRNITNYARKRLGGA